MNQHVKTITDSNWKNEIEDQSGVTLVDVWAPWCGPCKLIGPIIDELAQEYSGKASIGKLNADENRKPSELGVMGIPTLILYKDGQEMDRMVGFTQKQDLEQKLNYYLAG